MKRLLAVTSLALGLVLFGSAGAAEVEHYDGKPSRNMEEAPSNMAEYNRKLEEILAKEQLTVAEMERIRQLTYTLEKALARINSELTDVAATLQQVHLNFEHQEREAVNRHGREYLEGTRLLTD